MIANTTIVSGTTFGETWVEDRHVSRTDNRDPARHDGRRRLQRLCVVRERASGSRPLERPLARDGHGTRPARRAPRHGARYGPRGVDLLMRLEEAPEQR